MFHTILEGLCPQGWIPYEKCIPTAVLVCLRSHIGLIKASRKSIRKQPYSQYRCAVFTLEGLTVERWGWYHGCVCKGFQELAYFDITWHHSPLVPIVEDSVVLLVVMGSGGVVRRQMSSPQKTQINTLMFKPRNVILPMFTMKPLHTIWIYMCVCPQINQLINRRTRNETANKHSFAFSWKQWNYIWFRMDQTVDRIILAFMKFKQTQQ